MLQRIALGLLLFLVPAVVVQGIKQTDWGPILAAPQARQTGDPHAKVVIVEYSDFQCPSCARMQPTIHSFLDMYKGKIRVVYKYYPLTLIHKNAMSAAHAAECAAAQNQFWPYADRLFATQIQWAGLTDAATSYMAIAQETKLDPAKFSACYADPSQLAPIEADAKEAKAREVTATPTFFVNDERLVGGFFATDGARTIEKELRK